ncbi:MAG TPA: oligosaccharide flippase family protein [Ktedonobacteraceae bacterium]|nr:oligosaccharide flippase family protein [Ktedonobacteraceae bacterium]
MQKISLRPLRLVRFHDDQLEDNAPVVQYNSEYMLGNGETLIPMVKNSDGHEIENVGSGEATNCMLEDNHVISDDSAAMFTAISEKDAHSDTEAQHLLNRTPNSYLFNQIYGLWVYLSSFLLTILITHGVSTNEYGVYAVAQTAFNTILYIVAFGLEDATTTFIPRIFVEHGRAAAALLIRRLLGLRLVVLLFCVAILIGGLPVLAALISLIPVAGSADVAAGLRDPVLLSHILPIAVYVLGSSISSLLTAVCAAQMRMQIVLIIGSLTQLAIMGLAFFVLQLGWGINGVLWLQATASLCNATAYAIWLAPFLLTRGAEYKQPLKAVLQLGISAWLTNLASGALLKQVSIILLAVFAISLTQTGYFNLSFQMADAANLLLVAGFGGVSTSALAAAFVGKNYERLGRSWQVLIKVETLLAVPGLVFCLFNASNIAHAIYGSQYDAVGPLLVIFLFFNLLVRILGTTIHQPGLYVLGKARLVVLSQWIGMLTVTLVGLGLVPFFGPAGALVADGVARLVTGIMLLIFLLQDLPRRYPLELLNFTVRFVLALIIAALPSLLWHPSNQVLLVVSGAIFLVLCAGLLLLIKPLSAADEEMLMLLNPNVARYLRWFVRG